MSIEDNKQLAAEFIERFSSGDIDYAHETLAEDLEWVVTGSTLPIAGTYNKTQFREVNNGMVTSFVSSPKWIVDSMIAEGNQVAMVSHSMGDTPHGFEYRQKFHLLFTIRDGKIVRVIEYMDTQQVQDLIDHLAENGLSV